MTPDEYAAELAQRDATTQYRPMVDESEDASGDGVVFADESEWADDDEDLDDDDEEEDYPAEPVSTEAYLAAEHRAQVRHANAGRGLDEMVRLVRLGTMLQASLDASRDEHHAAQLALGAVHSTPIGQDPLPPGLHWEALDLVAKRLHHLCRRAGQRTGLLTDWAELNEASRDHWRREARALLVDAFAVGDRIEQEAEEAGRRYVAELEAGAES